LRLAQVLINYGNNAVKFTQSGEVQVSVSVVMQTDAEVVLRFAVRDTGIGLTQVQMSQLFRSFQQADTSISRQYGGTGLGLAIARELSALMGGEVGVNSRLGEGSTFWFTARLQRGQPAESSVSPATDVASVAAQIRDHHPGARILLAEDNAGRPLSRWAEAGPGGPSWCCRARRACRPGRCSADRRRRRGVWLRVAGG
jgi:two-component system sensor histidine kinase/response regulator